MTIYLNPSCIGDFEQLLSREWLETNGLGGWASSTLAGVNTRRYHGLLVAATNPPTYRMVLLSKFVEQLEVGPSTFDLDCNVYPGAIYPFGFRHLKNFFQDLYPVFEYECEGVRLRRSVLSIHGENTTLLKYELLSGGDDVVLKLSPLVAGRYFHILQRANSLIDTNVQYAKGVLSLKPYESSPQFFIQVPEASFAHDPRWYFNFQYQVDRLRGYDFEEDLFNHGKFSVRLNKSFPLTVAVSTIDPRGRSASALFLEEVKRREQLVQETKPRDEIERELILATDKFIVKRENFSTIIAGYHWFSDWGRDAMISLPGICLVSGRTTQARQILEAFAAHLFKGLIPNRFTDDDGKAEYNTVDATLWFFVAVYKYFSYSSDIKFIKEILPTLSEIIEWHDRGTLFGIKVDEDGLLKSGEEGVQLTWMDARVGKWVVTPRRGKPVEINALWYNALMILGELLTECKKKASAQEYLNRGKAIRKTYEDLFWNEARGALYDCIDGDQKDDTLRPNQIFALSLPYTLLSGSKAKQILDTVEQTLLTPYGLRTLEPSHPSYKPRYQGDQVERDFSYHQGTVWPWLLGPYLTALVRFGGRGAKSKATEIIKKFLSHLSEAGMGCVSEIFDGEAPHTPRGAIAQAWSTAEILRAYVEDVNRTETTHSEKGASLVSPYH